MFLTKINGKTTPYTLKWREYKHIYGKPKQNMLLSYCFVPDKTNHEPWTIGLAVEGTVTAQCFGLAK
jgi:hypothetical protein